MFIKIDLQLEGTFEFSNSSPLISNKSQEITTVLNSLTRYKIFYFSIEIFKIEEKSGFSQIQLKKIFLRNIMKSSSTLFLNWTIISFPLEKSNYVAIVAAIIFCVLCRKICSFQSSDFRGRWTNSSGLREVI